MKLAFLLWASLGVFASVAWRDGSFALAGLGFAALLLVAHFYETECAHRARADADAMTLALARVKSPAVERLEALAQQVEELQSQVTALRLNRGMQ